MIFASCSASLIHCITLTYPQESVYSHLNVIFNEGARGSQCGAPRTRKAWVLRPREKFEKNWENASVRYVSQKWNNQDLFETKLRLEKSSKAQFETNKRKKWDLVKTKKKEKIEPFFFLSGCFLTTFPAWLWMNCRVHNQEMTFTH